jgi:hypothetical protein
MARRFRLIHPHIPQSHGRPASRTRCACATRRATVPSEGLCFLGLCDQHQEHRPRKDRAVQVSMASSQRAEQAKGGTLAGLVAWQSSSPPRRGSYGLTSSQPQGSMCCAGAGAGACDLSQPQTGNEGKRSDWMEARGEARGRTLQSTVSTRKARCWRESQGSDRETLGSVSTAKAILGRGVLEGDRGYQCRRYEQERSRGRFQQHCAKRKHPPWHCSAAFGTLASVRLVVCGRLERERMLSLGICCVFSSSVRLDRATRCEECEGVQP